MTQQEFEKRKKKVKEWARNDARYYLSHPERVANETINEYFSRCAASYNKDRLIKVFNYTPEQAEEMLEWYNEQFWAGFRYWQNKYNKVEGVLQKYQKIFKEAEEIAKRVDVSDLTDGFPVGWAHLYLSEEQQKSELGKALATKNRNAKLAPFVYELPIRIPKEHQCIDYDIRRCEAVKSFLEQHGIYTHVYRMID